MADGDSIMNDLSDDALMGPREGTDVMLFDFVLEELAEELQEHVLVFHVLSILRIKY